jgi:hypothetical protein
MSVRLLLLLMWAGCGGDDGPVAPDRPQGGARVGGEVVATVDGVPITLDDVRREAEETGASPPAALRALVDRELLAGEAARLGYGDRRAVRRDVERALVQTLLAGTVEREITDASLDEAAVRAHHERARDRFPGDFATEEPAVRREMIITARFERLRMMVEESQARFGVTSNEQATAAALELALESGPP